MRKFVLFLCVLGFSLSVRAQNLLPSCKEEFLEKIYTESDTLSLMYFEQKTPIRQIQKCSPDTLIFQEEVQKHLGLVSDLWMRGQLDDFALYISCPEDDVQFDFFSMDQSGCLNIVTMLKSYGFCSLDFQTSQNQYNIEYVWGFLEIYQNGLSLLNCYCDIEQRENNVYMTIVPFEGTFLPIWEAYDEQTGMYGPAF